MAHSRINAEKRSSLSSEMSLGLTERMEKFGASTLTFVDEDKNQDVAIFLICYYGYLSHLFLMNFLTTFFAVGLSIFFFTKVSLFLKKKLTRLQGNMTSLGTSSLGKQ